MRTLDKKGIYVVGAGGHASSVVDVIGQEGRFSVSGLFECVPSEVGKLPIFPYWFITVGQIKTPDIRIGLFDAMIARGFKFPTIVSPRGYVSHMATVGDGTIVMHGALVNSKAQVGKNCILNTNSLIEHNCVIGDHCHISTGAILNGGVKVGMGTFIGSGALIKEGVTIGERKVIGMGEIVRRDIL